MTGIFLPQDDHAALPANYNLKENGHLETTYRCDDVELPEASHIYGAKFSPVGFMREHQASTRNAADDILCFTLPKPFVLPVIPSSFDAVGRKPTRCHISCSPDSSCSAALVSLLLPCTTDCVILRAASAQSLLTHVWGHPHKIGARSCLIEQGFSPEDALQRRQWARWLPDRLFSDPAVVGPHGIQQSVAM